MRKRDLKRKKFFLMHSQVKNLPKVDTDNLVFRHKIRFKKVEVVLLTISRLGAKRRIIKTYLIMRKILLLTRKQTCHYNSTKVKSNCN